MDATRPNVLVVDDDPLVLETLSKLLGHFGCNVIPHSDSTEALVDIEQRNDFALIVCDYEMPGINGEGLARAAKKKNPLIPVFVLSGTHPPSVARPPWDAWLLKGAPVAELLRKLNAVLRLAGEGARRAPLAADRARKHADTHSVS